MENSQQAVSNFATEFSDCVQSILNLNATYYSWYGRVTAAY